MPIPNSRIPTSTNSIHSKQSHHSLWIHAWDKFPYHHMQVILKQINSIITSHSFKTKEHKQKVLFIGFQLFKNHANITLQSSALAWNCIERVMTITHISCNSAYISTAMFSFCSFFFTQLCLFKDFSTIPYLLPSKVQDTIVTSLESRLDPHWSQSPGMPASQTERNSLPLPISPSIKQTNKRPGQASNITWIKAGSWVELKPRRASIPNSLRIPSNGRLCCWKSKRRCSCKTGWRKVKWQGKQNGSSKS